MSLIRTAIDLAALGFKKVASLTVGTSTPLVGSSTGSAGTTNGSVGVSAADHVHPLPSAAALNVLGLPCPWDPVNNIATLPSGSTIALQNGVAPTGDNSFYALSSATLSAALSSAVTSVNAGDIVYYQASNNWQKLANTPFSTTGTSILKGNGNGGVANASAGVDYAAPPVVQTGIPIGVAPPGYVGVNGFWTIPSSYVFPSGSGLNGLTNYYSTTGIWLYFSACSVYANSPAGFYYTVMGTTGIMYGTITAGGSSYTNGTYTNVPLTNITGTGSQALANITVAGGVVSRVVITHQGTGYAVGNTVSAAAANIGGTGSGFVFTVANLNAYLTTTGVTSLTITTAGSGYTNGTYFNVPLVSTQGSGVGAQATITVQGGAIVAAQIMVQGSGYSATAGSNQLGIATADLGGGGTGAVLTVAAIGAGPMTGIIYNNMYTPGVNTGAWATNNLSVQIPASPTPFSGTQGTYNVPTQVANAPISLVAVPVTGGAPGNNGRFTATYTFNAMNTSCQKVVAPCFKASSATGGYDNAFGGSYTVSTQTRVSVDTLVMNRGMANVQFGPSTTIAAAAATAVSLFGFNTANNFYYKTVAYFNSSYTSLWSTSGVIINGGAAYTNGTYTNVAMTGGGGTGMVCTIVVINGSVASVTMTNPGTGYVAGNTLSCSASSIGGTGSGFSWQLNGGIITSGGSSYTNGVYHNVPLTLTSGAGSGALAQITVSGGAVTGLLITNPGTGYTTGSVLSASATLLGSGGSGFSYTVGSSLTAPDWTVQEYVSLLVQPQP